MASTTVLHRCRVLLRGCSSPGGPLWWHQRAAVPRQ
jgi:hypothetical protein